MLIADANKHPWLYKAYQYANDVLSGNIDVCTCAKQVYIRHVSDLEKSKSDRYPYTFNHDKAESINKFISLMVHTKGEWTGKPLILEPWQLALNALIFGWVKKKDNTRRFTEVALFEPRKNGKTARTAAVGLYMLVADGEQGAEVYCGAASERQAFEVFKPARQMVLKNKQLQDKFKLRVGAKNISIAESLSKFETVIGKPLDGGSPSFAIIDEYHEHKSDEVYSTMTTGQMARRQPLTWIISTAGVDISSPCYDKFYEVKKLLSGAIENETLFGCIYEADDTDDWTDFKTWIKANPNYGVSIYEDVLKQKYQQAISNPVYQNINKCKHLNMWANASIGWINMPRWDRNKVDNLSIEDFKGEPCWIGVDLAQKVDLCAVMFLFKRLEDLKEHYYLFGKYYLPSETIERPENGHYRQWRDLGVITETAGAVTDFSVIEQDILEISKKYAVMDLSYDPREATYFIQSICEWSKFDCIEIQQNTTNLSEPMKEFEALYTDGRLHHSGDSCLKWQASNVVLKNPNTKTYYPAKERVANKIDGIVASLMALSRAKVFNISMSLNDRILQNKGARVINF